MPANGTNVTGNIDADPLFVDAVNGNLRLSKNALPIGQRDNSVIVPLIADLDGQPRISGTVDMGAYENPYFGCGPSQGKIILDHTYGPIDGIYFSNIWIAVSGSATIENGSNVILNTQNVDFGSGALVKLGAIFEVRIGDCP